MLASCYETAEPSGGAASYGARHSYFDIMPASLYETYPDAYLPEDEIPSGTSGWQLKPDNADVISHAQDWALRYLENNPQGTSIDTIPNLVVPVSPNDGAGWGSYIGDGTAEDIQRLTDLAFGLADNVSGYISETYPNAYVGIYNDGDCSAIPSFNFNNNIYTEIGTVFGRSNIPISERIESLVACGAIVGIYDYYDVWIWHHELPPDWAPEVLSNIKTYADEGVKCYTGEGGNEEGSSGIVHWLAAQLLWNPDSSIDDLLNDFYTRAFGPAAAPMADYFNRWFDGMSMNENSLALSFRDCQEAEILAAGDNAILDRIEFIEYYLRWAWKMQSRQTCSQSELEDLYILTTRLRDTCVNDYGYAENHLRGILKDRFPAAYPNNDAVYALRDFTLPTEAETAAWLNEALTYFAGEEGYDAPYINPLEVTLHALGDTSISQLNGIHEFPGYSLHRPSQR
jgi:hypothetical protein